MTSNLQIGLAYVIGKVDKTEHKLVHLDEVLDKDIYKPYILTMHYGAHNKSYVLYKNLGESIDSKKLAEIDDSFTLTQIICILEQVIGFDKKRK